VDREQLAKQALEAIQDILNQYKQLLAASRDGPTGTTDHGVPAADHDQPVHGFYERVF